MSEVSRKRGSMVLIAESENKMGKVKTRICAHLCCIGFYLMILYFPVKVFCFGSNTNITRLSLDQCHYFTLSGSSYEKFNVDLQNQTYLRNVIVQGHSQSKTISISSKLSCRYPEFFTYNATNVGLPYLLHEDEQNITTYFMPVNNPTRAVLIAVPYKIYAPVPGGCCITCSFDDDPNIQVSYDDLRTKIMFQRANIFYPAGSRPPVCDGYPYSTFKLEYDLYCFFLEENNFSEDELFKGLWKMSAPSRIKTYGIKVATLTSTKFPEFDVQTLRGLGVVYNIIVRYPKNKTEAAYNPSFTYACDFDKLKDSCKTFGSLDEIQCKDSDYRVTNYTISFYWTWLGSVTTMVYCILGGIIGLVMCFAGLKFFKCQLFLSGLLTVWLVSYILFTRFTTYQYTLRMVSSTATGTLGGLFLLLVYIKGSPRYVNICLLNSGFLLGFYTACIVFFAPVGRNEVFEDTTVFILTVIGITLAVPIPFIFFPKALSIIFSSFFGSYGLVTVMNFFMRAKVSYILLNMILRVAVPGYHSVYQIVPFQKHEYILCAMWAFIALLGMAVQYYTTKDEHFPPPKTIKQFSFVEVLPRRLRRLIRRKRETNQPQTNERTPLLSGNNVQHYDRASSAPVNVV